MNELFNPADYFTYVLDQEIREAGMPGGYCGFALQLAAEPDLYRLQTRLDLLVEMFPKASARIEQQGKRHVWIPTGRRIPLEYHTTKDDADTQRVLLEIFNQRETLPLSLHWIGNIASGTLLLNWNHPLLDARGAKILLDFLASEHPEKFKESPSLINAKLEQWSFWKKLHLLIL